MALPTLSTLHSFLKETNTPVSHGGHIKSFSHDTGSGPVLVMVHGWPQSSYMWRQTAPAFENHMSLFIPELPGYGFSSLPPQHDKRTVGNLILEAFQQVFPNRKIIWCGHDRGGRIGHRLIVDNNPSHSIIAAILLDIVPTTEQWAAFSNPAAGVAYYHWPFLATSSAPQMIEAMGGYDFTKINLEKARGKNAAGVDMFQDNDAVHNYCTQFRNPECIQGSCADYAAGATEDVQAQKEDQEAGRKIEIPTLVIYSASNLGRMHDVDAIWPKWTAQGTELKTVAIPDGYGHYLPEECPAKVIELVQEWVEKFGGM